MKIKEAMTSDVKLTSPDETIQQAARRMADLDVGMLPVAQGDGLVGMITDRDIAVRAVAKGLPASTPVGDVMSREVLYCFENDDIEDVVENMSEVQVRRLPVLNADKRLVGIIALADIAAADGVESAGEAVCGISEPGGPHSQSNKAA